METKTMTKEELVNRVENFCHEIAPAINAMNHEVGKREKAPALVLSLVVPTDEDEDGHQNVTCIVGKGVGVMECIHDLDRKDADGDNLIQQYLKHKRAKMLEAAHEALEDVLKDFGEFMKARAAENAETEDDTETQAEGDAE